MTNILENLKKIRESKNLSQEQIAEMMNKTQSSYARIERGATKIEYEDLVIFSQAVGLNVIDIITYPDKYVSKREAENSIKATLQIELQKETKDKILKLVFGENELQILNT